MGRVKCDHIKRLITLTGDDIKRLSLYNNQAVHFSLEKPLNTKHQRTFTALPKFGVGIIFNQTEHNCYRNINNKVLLVHFFKSVFLFNIGFCVS
jgi:hypothetical protein